MTYNVSRRTWNPAVPYHTMQFYGSIVVLVHCHRWRKSSNITVQPDILNPPLLRLTSRKPLWLDLQPVDIKSQWRHNRKSAQVVNSHLVCDPTIRQPGFDLPRQHWSLLNCFRTEQGHCGACRRKWQLADADLCPCGETQTKWRLTDTDLCPCGKTQTMSHIVESCPLTKLNGGLSRPHSADEDAVSSLTNYSSWHAYEKKKKWYWISVYYVFIVFNLLIFTIFRPVKAVHTTHCNNNHFTALCQDSPGEFLPITSTWPHLRYYVGLEEGEYKQYCLCTTLLCTIYNGGQWYKQFLQVRSTVSGSHLAWFSSLSSDRLCIFGLHGAM